MTTRTQTQTKTISRTLPSGDYVEATLEVRHPGGTLSAGFSLTGAVWEQRGRMSGTTRHARRPEDPDMAGQVTDHILQAFPHLAPFAAAHLADLDGTPMHAVANGWYFYSGKSSRYEREHYGDAYVERMGTDHDRAARALHIDPADLPTGLDEDGFHDFAASLVHTWAEQARAALAVFDSIEDGES